MRLLATILLGGALWGAIFGLWIGAPLLADAHTLVPRTFEHRLLFAAVMAAISAGLGAALSTFLAFPLLAWQAARRRSTRDAAWTLVLSLGPLVPLGYLLVAVFVELAFFGRVPWSRRPPTYAAAGVGAYLAAAAALVMVHRSMSAAGPRPPVRRLLATLAAATCAGALILPFRLPSPTVAPMDGGPLVRRLGDAAHAPLLLLGLDSANWDTLQPLLDQAALPTFGRLVSNGMRGNVHALWKPYWSVPAWASIVTGHPNDETDVHGDLAMEAPGFPPFYAPLIVDVLLDPFYLVEWQLIGMKLLRVLHPPRPMVQRPPVWELLDDAGVATGVVRFDFTYPAVARHGLVVSNHLGRDNWGLVRAQPGVGDALVAPRDRARDLLAPFSEQRPFDEGLLDEILPREDHGADGFDMGVLRTALDIDDRSIQAAQYMLRTRPDLPFLAVYLSGLDEVCHAFWEYRFPEAYGAAAPRAEDVARWGRVIDRYLQFIDRRLERLIDAYAVPPNVVVVSDHGHEAVFDHPVWRGWHGPIGVFIASGPDFPQRAEPFDVSYYDVVPTVLDAMGFAVPDGAHGVSLRR